jgi:hypothetical protein
MSTIVSAANPTVTGRRIESIDILPWRVPLKEAEGDRIPGSARGQVHLSPDFDAPLDDFADYQ